jgi:hypothetical protein
MRDSVIADRLCKPKALRHSTLRHPPDKPACFFVLDERQADADMTAALPRTGKVLGDFIETHVAMIDLDEKLQRTLQPNVQASHARRFDDCALVQIA